MNRVLTALSLSVSLVAIGMASLALSRNGARGGDGERPNGRELREVRRLLTALTERIEGIESRRPELMTVPQQSTPTAEAPVLPPGGLNEVQEQITALTLRLASLEDGETIARLAKSGETQLLEREFREALDRTRNPEAPPEDRLEALRTLRRLGKTNPTLIAGAAKGNGVENELDVVLPMLGLAQDTQLEPEFRADVLRNLIGSKVQEVREPLLGLLALDAAPEVRGEAMHALMYHLDEPVVREAIVQAARGDPDEGVRARGEKYMPKVEYVAQEAAAADTTVKVGQEK